VARPPAIIFDCDGVLVDSEDLASRVEAELTRELGLNLTTAEAHDLFLGKTVDGVLATIAARAGKGVSASFSYNWAFATAHAFMRELKAVAEVRAVVGELRQRGHEMAVASQSPLARVKFSLDVTGLAEFFGERLYVTSMVARPKPAPDIYLHAARQLGAEPAACLVVEDSPAGAAAARSAGFQVLGYAPGDTAASMRAAGVPVIASMSEVLPRVASLAGAATGASPPQ